jgi:hypothetical protein
MDEIEIAVENASKFTEKPKQTKKEALNDASNNPDEGYYPV